MSTKSGIALAAAISTALLVTGCATTPEGQEQAAGAGIGCIVGGALAGIITRDARYAAAGCAAGAALGFSVVKVQQYNAIQARSGDTDMRKYRKSDPDFYGLRTPVTSSSVKIRDAATTPQTVSRGQMVIAKTDYSVVTPPGSATVRVDESWVLKKDGKVITTIKSDPQQRDAAGWKTEGGFTIPADAAPGTYIVEHKVTVGTVTDTRDSYFVVKS
jgi:hypothetical protein